MARILTWLSLATGESVLTHLANDYAAHRGIRPTDSPLNLSTSAR